MFVWSRGCASTPICSRPRRRAAPDSSDGRPRKIVRFPNSPRRSKTKQRAGPNCRCPIGTAINAAFSNSQPERRSGITPDCRRRRSAGCSRAIQPAFLCTDIDATPVEILGWFVHRWSVETTFQESRAHLGVETRRQWSDLAIARMTPALLGLFSLVTLWAADPTVLASLHPRSAAWYQKREPSFSDAIAAVRRLLWSPPTLSISRLDPDRVEIPTMLWQRLTETLCYAA